MLWLPCRFLDFILVLDFIDYGRRPRVAVDWFFSFYIRVHAHNTMYYVYFQCVPIEMQEREAEVAYIVEPISRNHKNHTNHSSSLLVFRPGADMMFIFS